MRLTKSSLVESTSGIWNLFVEEMFWSQPNVTRSKEVNRSNSGRIRASSRSSSASVGGEDRSMLIREQVGGKFCKILTAASHGLDHGFDVI